MHRLPLRASRSLARRSPPPPRALLPRVAVRAHTSLWDSLYKSAGSMAASEPLLAPFLHHAVLSHSDLAGALGAVLSHKLGTSTIPAASWLSVIEEAVRGDPAILHAVETDMRTILERDPSCTNPSHILLHFKGFHAVSCHRVAHWLWRHERKALAFFVQGRVSDALGVDIHPAARFGCGVMVDHATGLVVGETAVVGDGCALLHNVTLGGTGKERGDRHPKLGCDVLVGAGASILGNVKIGDGARIGANSVVLADVEAGGTVAGVAATTRRNHPASIFHAPVTGS